MLKRITWRVGDVYVLKVSDECYTLVQMRENHLLQFFALASKSGKFSGINLDAEQELFTIFVAENRIKELFVRKTESDEIRANTKSTNKLMLSPIFGIGGAQGAQLIELTDRFSSVDGKIIKDKLTAESDRDNIYSYELAGMIGSADKIKDRLVRYFETGINWDESKRFVFRSIEPPKRTNSCNPPLKRI
jgi:hypothetical protein